MSIISSIFAVYEKKKQVMFEFEWVGNINFVVKEAYLCKMFMWTVVNLNLIPLSRFESGISLLS